MTKERWAIALMVGLFVVLFLVEAYAPKPVDWTSTFHNEDKIPYGSFVLYEELAGILGNERIIEVHEPVYNHLAENECSDCAFLFVNESCVFAPEDEERLLDFVDRGNTVLVSAKSVGLQLLDSLGVEFTNVAMRDSSAKLCASDSIELSLSNCLYKEDDWRFPRGHLSKIMVLPDSLENLRVGHTCGDRPNFIRFGLGKGHLYLHSAPHALSNYFILKEDTREYAESLLSHIDVKGEIYWDEYYKVGRDEKVTSLWRFIISSPPLKWGFRLLGILTLIFMLFKSKRIQRVIPIKERFRNSTLDFVKTISALYQSDNSHKNLAEKKISFLMEFISSRFLMKDFDFGKDEIELLSKKSGVDQERLGRLAQLVSMVRSKSVIQDWELINVNNQIDEFFKLSTR